MTPFVTLIVLLGYFGVLLFISYLTSRKADTNDFFKAGNSSPWYLVAFGMVGTSLSGITFISVPGQVLNSSFGYLQMCMGYLVGYAFIAFVLLPLYYKVGSASIYAFLEERFGHISRKTASAFFLFSRTLGSSLRLFVACIVLHNFIFKHWGVPFELTVAISILFIWLYSSKGGIKTIVWTDTLQTLFLLLAAGVSIVVVFQKLDWSVAEAFTAVSDNAMSKTFFWDWKEGNYFWKMFISGAVITIVMTGLDQDMMQKNLSCKNLKDAQKNVLSMSVVLFLANVLFLSLGAILYIYAQKEGVDLPTNVDGKTVTDRVFPMLAMNHFGTVAALFFLIGITASTYSSCDSALAALTTSFCLDFLNFEKKEEKQKRKEKRLVHISFSVLYFLVILAFRFFLSEDALHTLFKLAGYTYGPLLSLFAVAILFKWKVKDKAVPFVLIAAPLLTLLIVLWVEFVSDYEFSFELILLNGLIGILGLFLIRENKPTLS